MDYTQIILTILGVLLSVIGFLAVYLLNDIKNDISELRKSFKENADAVADHETRLSILESEHNRCYYPRAGSLSSAK